MFVSRDRCLSCGFDNLTELSGGRFSEDPLRSFIDADPWGENPLPTLADNRWSLVQCDRCMMKFHRYILSPEWNEIRFSKWMDEESIRQFEEQHGNAAESGTPNAQHVLRLRDLGVKRVLDFGCGFGQFLQMCSLFGLSATGVDRSNARRGGAAVQIYAELSEVEDTFDAITMFEVLEHLDDPLAMLNTLKERLNPGGVMIIEVPDTTDVTNIKTRTDYHQIHPLDHINAFTPETLVGMLKQAGFAPIIKKPAFVTTRPMRLAKDIAKAALKSKTTQRYFRRVDAQN